jgi:hypothetical protein
MTDRPLATHIYVHLYPELGRDDVSRYVAYLRDRKGEKKIGGVYSVACKAAPVGDNPMGLRRGSVVEIEDEKYLCLGSSFMALEFASLEHPGQGLTMDFQGFSKLLSKMRVLDPEASKEALASFMGQ